MTLHHSDVERLRFQGAIGLPKIREQEQREEAPAGVSSRMRLRPYLQKSIPRGEPEIVRSELGVLIGFHQNFCSLFRCQEHPGKWGGNEARSRGEHSRHRLFECSDRASIKTPSEFTYGDDEQKPSLNRAADPTMCGAPALSEQMPSAPLTGLDGRDWALALTRTEAMNHHAVDVVRLLTFR